MPKKKAVMFTVADSQNLPYAKMLANSLRKFHSEEELPLLIYSPDEKTLQKDPDFFYRQKPHFAKELIKDYDLVIGADADQIITGDLNHILNDESYDIGGVINWNRIDPQLYGLVQVWDINPSRYLNCGLVAMRSKQFIDHWWELCTSEHFDVYQYKEQDLLNILAWYCQYKVKVFDWEDTFNGLISKGEWPRVELEKDQLILDPDAQGFPERRKIIKVLHWAGGSGADKMNYRIGFNDAVIERLDYLVSDAKKDEKK